MRFTRQVVTILKMIAKILPAAVTSGKQPILAPDSDAPHRLLGQDIADRDVSILQ